MLLARSVQMDCFQGEKGYIGFGQAIVSNGVCYNAHEHNIRRQVGRMAVDTDLY